MKNTLSLPVTNENGSYEIRLESIGGLGANLCGKMLGELGALSLSLNSLSFSSYGSEKRGSPVKAYVRWCADDRPLRVNSPVTRPHLLGIFHGGLIGTYPVLEGVTVDTKIVLNTPLSADEAADKYHISIGELYCLDALVLAMESHSRINMVMLGALVRASGFIPPEAAETLCRDTIGKNIPHSSKPISRVCAWDMKMSKWLRATATSPLCRTPRRTGMLGAMPTLRSAASIRGSEAPSPTI